MKKLIIVRHAKSSWGYQIEDKNRPLKEIGIKRAQEHAELLRQNISFDPEYWASSFATRALHTAIIFAEKFNHIDNLKIQENLYTFSKDELKKSIQNIPNVIESAIIFGHNNACLNLINELIPETITEFKTASCVVIQFNLNRWEDIQSGKLEIFISKNQML